MGELRFLEPKLRTKWAMVESLSSRGPPLSATSLIKDPETSSITSQLTNEFKATEISHYPLILINIPERRMPGFPLQC